MTGPHPFPAGRPLVGVLGGMGPAATADFFAKLVRATPAVTDQDHLPTLVWSDPSIPDRTEALLARGPSPIPRLLAGLRVLDGAGATLIAMPCNTAHAFLPHLRRAVRQPIVSMVDATVRRLVTARPQVSSVGLLATTGTVTAGMYQAAFHWRAVHCLVPSERHQQSTMRAIRLVKAGELAAARRAVDAPVRALAAAGAEVVVAACTELPLILGSRTGGRDVFDATTALAEEVVELARTQNWNRSDKESPCVSASA
ncbi:aspartate/glutamate racemase family protein [Micromonospora sp. DT233]|uniref:aspartate/glutamate racemase family protein n=1 Tax=Micromonospora sp. DT233 TaxID=3393432 RepID=UPI003CF43502